MILPLRKAIFWVHLVCGVATGAVILVMSVTGVLLTYQTQMVDWSDRQYWTPPAIPGERAPLSELVRQARTYGADVEVASVTVYSDPEAPAAIAVRGGPTLYLDPSTAEVRGENTTAMRTFFSHVVGWHRWFNIRGDGRTTARAITGWSNLVFLFLVVSGLYLWFPRRWRWQHFRAVLVLNPKARGKARDFNWHHVFGFWMAVPLALVVASATVISFPWASDLAYRVVGDTPPSRAAARTPPAPAPVPPAPRVASAASLGEDATTFMAATWRFDPIVLDRVGEGVLATEEPWRTATFSLPGEASDPIDVRVDGGRRGEPQKRQTLAFDAETGVQTATSTFADESPGRRLRSYLRFAHTGEYYGVVGQTVAGVASFAGILLVWSGLALAWRRLIRPLRWGSRTEAAAGPSGG